MVEKLGPPLGNRCDHVQLVASALIIRLLNWMGILKIAQSTSSSVKSFPMTSDFICATAAFIGFSIVSKNAEFLKWM
jgi:hypothetical protein